MVRLRARRRVSNSSSRLGAVLSGTRLFLGPAAGDPIRVYFCWWPVAERLVQTAVVEPVDAFKDRELELGARPPDAIFDQLGLEAVDKALGHPVRLRCRLRLIGRLGSELSV